MRTEQSIEIAAPATVVWAVYSDLEGWPSWTDSVRSLTVVEGDGLALDTVVRIDQPRLPTVTWRVTEHTAGRSWAWETRAPGAHTVATHTLTPLDEGATRVDTAIDQLGPLGALVGRLTAGLTRRYLLLEAEGVKAASEARAA